MSSEEQVPAAEQGVSPTLDTAAAIAESSTALKAATTPNGIEAAAAENFPETLAQPAGAEPAPAPAPAADTAVNPAGAQPVPSATEPPAGPAEDNDDVAAAGAIDSATQSVVLDAAAAPNAAAADHESAPAPDAAAVQAATPEATVVDGTADPPSQAADAKEQAALMEPQTTTEATVPATAAAEPSEKPAPYAFTGMQCLLDKATSPVNALSFGRLDSSLLAFGADDGCVRVASIGPQKASIMHEMREHTKRVTDLDWSLENQQLLTSAEDGSVLLSSDDDMGWTMIRRFETSTAAMACRFHQVNQSLIIVGTGAGTLEVFNTSTGLVLDDCKAQLSSNQPEGVSVASMDCSRDTLYVGDSLGYLHVFRLALKGGMLAPLTLLARVPPAGNRLALLASLSFKPWAASVTGPALLAAGTDDLISIYRVVGEKGGRQRLELASKHLLPQSARPIRAAWCPTLPSNEPEYIAMGGEDTSVNVYDISDATQAPVPVVKLQGHHAPVIAVAWAFDERRLASADCNGTVIVWKREHAEDAIIEDTPY